MSERPIDLHDEVFWRDKQRLKRIYEILKLGHGDPDEVVDGVANAAAQSVHRRSRPRGRPSVLAVRVIELAAKWPPEMKDAGRPKLWSDATLDALQRRVDAIRAAGAPTLHAAMEQLASELPPMEALDEKQQHKRQSLFAGLERALRRRHEHD